MFCGKRKPRRCLLATVPRDPKSAVAFQQAQESGSDPADRRLDALLVALAHDLDRRAIGHDDEFAAAEHVADGLGTEAGRNCYVLGSSHQDSQDYAKNKFAPLHVVIYLYP